MQDGKKIIGALSWGSLIGVLGGLIGLGGAEFRLPVLIEFFHFPLLQAIIINLTVSLVTVVFALIFRLGLTNPKSLVEGWPIILNILIGSLGGSYLGAHIATRVRESFLRKTVALFLVIIGFILIGHDVVFHNYDLQLPFMLKGLLGVVLGLGIGIFSSMLGVAGGELIIPTLIIIFAQDIKIAGTLSLAISIPTILLGLIRYERQRKWREIIPQRTVILGMALGSILGARVGSQLLQYAPSAWLEIFLGCILFISAYRLFHEKKDGVSTD